MIHVKLKYSFKPGPPLHDHHQSGTTSLVDVRLSRSLETRFRIVPLATDRDHEL